MLLPMNFSRTKGTGMLEIENYIFPKNLDEAYTTLHQNAGTTILGGCGYIRLGARKIKNAIDLSKLGLAAVTETESAIEIGAMCCLREFEINPLITDLGNGLLAESVKNIVGIQLRNSVTVGGTVAGRYPFSDPITALIAMGAEIEFHNAGRINLHEYLQGKGFKDIVTKIVLPKTPSIGAFESIRKSATDYAVLNTAIVKTDTQYRVVVGSRPGKAVFISQAMNYLQDNKLTEATIVEAARLVTESAEFGDNPRGSKDYRKAICPVLIKRALQKIAGEC